MAVNALADLADRLRALSKDLGGSQMERVMAKLGEEAKRDEEDAVRADIGDLSMSGWRPGKPIQIVAEYKVLGPTEIVVRPRGQSRGPWRVLNDGRTYGASTDLILVGRARKNGTRRARSRGRGQSSSRGKGSWDDGVALVDKRTPDRAINAIYEEVMVKRLG